MTALPLIDEPLWSGLGLVAPLQARMRGRVPAGVRGISIDTRTLQPGDLFFAIKGENSDGHTHLGQAFTNGAAAAVVDEDHAEAPNATGPVYVVKDVLAAMENLGRAARARSTARIAAVTGSVGKTSTKEALALVLSDAGPTHASTASYNNHWGVPLTLARMAGAARYGVFEIGMNHAGEITPLVALVRPHVAIITTIAPVHLAQFSGIEAIAAAKAEIFTGIVKGGVAILHRDIAQWGQLQKAANAAGIRHVLSFGSSKEADARITSIDVFPEGTYVEAEVLGQSLRYRMAAPGKHFAENSLAVLLAARAMGLDLVKAAKSLEHFRPPAGRGHRIVLRLHHGEATLIDESHNANPASMRAALEVLGALPVTGEGRRIAVLGDMLELGPDEKKLHAEISGAISRNKIDVVFAAGPLMRQLYELLPKQRRGAWFATAAELEAAIVPVLVPGDVIMIKGSNGSRMGPLAKALATQFSSARPILSGEILPRIA